MKHWLPTEEVILASVITFGMLLLVWTNVSAVQIHQQFLELAYSFLNGKLHFPESSGYVYDASYYNGHFYWPLGPLPALVLIPFIFLLGGELYQGLVQFLFICISFWLLYKIAKKILENKTDALWVSFGYIFSTAFIGVALIPWSWQFAQIVASVFVLAAIYEYFYTKRWLLVGLFIGLAIAVRSDLILSLVFFASLIIFKEQLTSKKVWHLVKLLTPVGISIFLLGLYNYFRFDNFLDQGYLYQNLTTLELIQNRDAALWGFVHIPANIYYFFFKAPEAVFLPNSKILTYPYVKADPWGMSIFFTSPLFLWIIKAPFKRKEVIYAGITAFLLAFAIFGYYGIGFSQYGYRYALDFYPFLYLMLLYAVKARFTVALKIIIVLTFLFNVYMNQAILFS